MKDAKIYTGTGWQSLKGPPGPSAVSADAGNTLTLGGDGLHFTTAPPDSDAYVWCKHGDDPQERYDLAKTLRPNGQPLSATNRATLIILTGTYAGSLNVDAEFVDAYGMGQQQSLPAVMLGGINVTADDVRVSGIGVGTQPFKINGLAGQRFTNCTGGNSSFGSGISVAGTFINCTSTGVGSFGTDGDVSGTFINCTSGDRSFGRGVGTVSGTFTNCTSGKWSFGGSGGGSSVGTFTNCTAGATSFGGQGQYTNCVCTGNNGFEARRPTATSGTFIDCTSGTNSFGGNAADANVTGTFINCTAVSLSFGGAYSGTLKASARLIGCRVTAGTFPPAPEDGAILRFCLDGTFQEVNTP